MIKTVRDFNVRGKRVLVRCDFNVPLSEKGDILDDFRIKKTIPTIEYLIERRGKIILMSHLDDPQGKIIEKLKLDKVQEKLIEYLDVSVAKAKDCVGSEIEKWIREMSEGGILLLENLRFYKEEEENNLGFARELSKLGDIYINDAFGVCHRAHASVVGVPNYLPKGIGFLLEKEIKILNGVIKNPQRPLVAIIGGAKVENKIKLINKISEVADFILIGGLLNKELKDYNPPTTSSRSLRSRAPKNISLMNPQKIIGAKEGLDIGLEVINLFKEKISKAKTVFWNGPLGQIEKKEFTKGTQEIAKAVIESGAFSVVGGGETVEFINKIGLTEKFNHVSTGGGAMMAYLAGEKLPGLEVLK